MIDVSRSSVSGVSVSGLTFDVDADLSEQVSQVRSDPLEAM